VRDRGEVLDHLDRLEQQVRTPLEGFVLAIALCAVALERPGARANMLRDLEQQLDVWSGRGNVRQLAEAELNREGLARGMSRWNDALERRVGVLYKRYSRLFAERLPESWPAALAELPGGEEVDASWLPRPVELLHAARLSDPLCPCVSDRERSQGQGRVSR